MESSFIGIVVLVVIAGFVAYKFLGNKDSESSSGGGSVSEPAPAVKVSKLPSKAELSKMTKKAIDEMAADEGIKLDARKTKDAMIKDFQKEFKAQQK